MSSNNRSLEIRAGLVLYGGVSLAVYMGGAAAEFLRAVKSGSDGPAHNRERRRLPYADLLDRLGARFVVDVISGTSAGGINGVFLARALATGGNLDHMGRLWRTAGDMSRLLDWGTEDDPPASLLNGRFFQRELVDALSAVGRPGGDPLVDVLDLHVTATDIEGRYWRRFDHLGHEILGRQYRKDFNLKFRRKFRLAGRGEELGYERNDFAGADAGQDREKIEWLAKLSRTTAAFPAAFEPMPFTREEAYDHEPGETAGFRTKIWMTDGGVLQNHPFAPAISTIFRRAADRPVERLLFYVEPALADAWAPSGRGRDLEPNALRTALSAFELPLYQGIDQHLRDIEDHNRSVDDVRGAIDVMREAMREDRLGAAGTAGTAGTFERSTPAFAAYLALRRRRVAGEMKARLESAYRAFRAGNSQSRPAAGTGSDIPPYDWLPGVPGADDDRFLDRFDFRFQERRVYFVIEQLTRYYTQVLKQAASRGGPDRDLKRWHEAQTEREALLWGALEKLRQAEWEWWNRDDLFRAGEEDAPNSMAGKFRRGLSGRLEAWRDEAEERLKTVLAEASRPPEFLRAASEVPEPGLVKSWERFERYDALLYPLAIGSTLGERDQIEWVRISPYDADTLLRDDPASRSESVSWARREQYGSGKVAGDSLFNFGGFLSHRWRRNDYMWGRLDAADLLITSFIKAAERSGHFGRESLEGIARVAQNCRLLAFREILKDELDDQDLRALDRPVDDLDWDSMRTFLLERCRTGREKLKDLHPGVLAHTAVDLADNARVVIGRIARESQVRLPRAVQMAASALGSGLGWARAAVKALVPRPDPGEDDRAAGAGFGIAFWVIALAAGWFAREMKEWFLAPNIGGLLPVLGTATAVLIAWYALFPVSFARFFRALPPLGSGWAAVGVLLFLVGDSSTLPALNPAWPAAWPGKAHFALTRDLGIWLVAGWGFLNAARLTGRLAARDVPEVPSPRAVSLGHQIPVKPPGMPPGSEAGHPPEGIAFDNDGRLVVTTLTGYVLRWEAGGWRALGNKFKKAVLGLVVDPYGGLLVAAAGGVWRWTGENSDRWIRLAGIPGANGLAVARGGDEIYVSSMTRLSVWRLRRSAASPWKLMARKRVGWFWGPNGLAVRARAARGEAKEEETLIVAETLSWNGRVLEIPLRSGGRRVLARTGPLQFPDGVLSCRDGLVAVSTNRGFVHLIDPEKGAVIDSLRFPPDLVPANLVESEDRVWFAGLGRLRPPSQGHSVGSFVFPPRA